MHTTHCIRIIVKCGWHGRGDNMEEYRFLLDIAIILAATKALGLFSKKVSLPPVVGALLAGILLGPAVFHVISPSDSISKLAEVGVIVLMFEAGLETDIHELKKSGVASFVIALLGVLIPLLGGFVVGEFYQKDIMHNVFIGVVLTATSVSITVETLQDMGKLKGKVGTTILGAAIIDDILGIIMLSIITSLGGEGTNNAILPTLGKMLLFFVIAILGGILVHYFFKWLATRQEEHRRRIPVFAFAFCLFLSFISELFGIADITGAYIAGVVLCGLTEAKYILSKVEVVSYMLITPIFFANIGLDIQVSKMTSNMLIFTGIITLVAILSKVIGCGLGAKLCRYTGKEGLQIGVGMVCRGEVALIVANKGLKVGLMKEEFFAPIVIMVIVTTLLTPILLKMVFHEKEEKKKVAA